MKARGCQPRGPSPRPLARGEAGLYAAWFRALADPTRIQVLSLLARAEGPLSVGEIVHATEVGQSTVSQHLKVLGEVGFVFAERRGTANYYRLNDACVASFPTAADLVIGRQPPSPHEPGRIPGSRWPAAAQEPAQARDDRPAAGALARITVRPMASADAAQVLAIYQAGLDGGEASFETRAPTWEMFDAAHLPSHRHVAAGVSGEIAGWAAASAVSDRCVYHGVVEASVYVAPTAHGRGVGAALLRALISSTEAAGIWTIQSGIFPENGASLRLHEQAGFRVVGTRARLGRHHGRWRDVVLLERRSARVGAA